jgi:hypothetical protein
MNNKFDAEINYIGFIDFVPIDIGLCCILILCIFNEASEYLNLVSVQ